MKFGEDEWEGHIIDGYIPGLQRIKDIYRETFLDSYGTSKSSESEVERNLIFVPIDTLFISSVDAVMRKFSVDITIKYPELLTEINGRPQCKFYCDTYLLNLQQNKNINRSNKPQIIKEAYTHLDREISSDQNKKSYRHILIFSHYHPETKSCIQEALEKTEFTVKQRKQYEKIERYEKAGEWLIEEGFRVFIAPCNVVEERLVDLNFECTRP